MTSKYAIMWKWYKQYSTNNIFINKPPPVFCPLMKVSNNKIPLSKTMHILKMTLISAKLSTWRLCEHLLSPEYIVLHYHWRLCLVLTNFMSKNDLISPSWMNWNIFTSLLTICTLSFELSISFDFFFTGSWVFFSLLIIVLSQLDFSCFIGWCG